MMGWDSNMWVLMGSIMGICVLIVLVLYYLYTRRSHYTSNNNKKQTQKIQDFANAEILGEVKHNESHFCPICGEKLDDETLKYCPYCGSEI